MKKSAPQLHLPLFQMLNNAQQLVASVYRTGAIQDISVITECSIEQSCFKRLIQQHSINGLEGTGTHKQEAGMNNQGQKSCEAVTGNRILFIKCTILPCTLLSFLQIFMIRTIFIAYSRDTTRNLDFLYSSGEILFGMHEKREKVK